jgi:hypothetical protein
LANYTWSHHTDKSIEIEYVPGKPLRGAQTSQIEDACQQVLSVLDRLEFNVQVGGEYKLTLFPNDGRQNWVQDLDIKPTSGRVKISVPDWFTFEEQTCFEQVIDTLIGVARAVDIVKIQIVVL